MSRCVGGYGRLTPALGNHRKSSLERGLLVQNGLRQGSHHAVRNGGRENPADIGQKYRLGRRAVVQSRRSVQRRRKTAIGPSRFGHRTGRRGRAASRSGTQRPVRQREPPPGSSRTFERSALLVSRDYPAKWSGFPKNSHSFGQLPVADQQVAIFDQQLLGLPDLLAFAPFTERS